jgi:sulfur carrier protein
MAPESGEAAANTGPHGAEVSPMGPQRSRRTAASRDAPPCLPGDNRGMDILLNGDPATVADDSTIASLLEARGLAGRRVAVEVNGRIVPRGRHADHALEAGDRVEIVHALGGG